MKTNANQPATAEARTLDAGVAARAVCGGILMGLANLVPGISGGTMLLATGVYTRFINGIAELTRLRFRPATILTLLCIVGAALAAIVALAGPISELVIHRRWIMYSLFIGLTLGGVPIIWRMAKPIGAAIVFPALVGIALMAVMAFVTPGGGAAGVGGAADASHPYFMLFLAGLAGATAMVLPGISGGYLLLILGQYVTILVAVSVFKDGLRAGDWSLVGETLHTIVPVGVGVVFGVVGVSNLVKVLLERCERPTLGLLLGLLLGAVLGLWPFQEGVAPAPGSIFRGERVAEVDAALVMMPSGREIEPKDFDTAFFTPSAMHIVGALALIAAGLAVSIGIAHIGTTKRDEVA